MLIPQKFRHTRITTVLIAAVLGLAAIGCSQTSSSQPASPSAAQAKAEAPRSAESIVQAQPDRDATSLIAAQPVANADASPSPAEILEGRYLVGGTGQGLEVQGERYRYTDEEGEKPWRSLTELESIKSGIVFDGNAYWCLASTVPKSGITACSETGWVKPIAAESPSPVANRAAIFTCTTDNGKEIQLFETEKTIDYNFGRPGETPELELQVPRDQASTRQWHGFGRWMDYSVSVPNGDTTYVVFSGVDKLSPRKESGVRVEQNGETLTTVNCANVTTNNLRGVQLKAS
jgi:hypothetical protein